MTDRDVHLISAFFFYVFLDEDMAVRASHRAFPVINKKIKKNKLEKDSVFVTTTFSLWNSYRKHLDQKIKIREEKMTSFSLSTVYLEKWISFREKAAEDEFLAVIWNKVLGISEKDISLGLGVGLGTVRYRVGRGLSLLGEQA